VPSTPSPHVHPRIRTFQGRRSRMTPTQQEGLAELGHHLLPMQSEDLDQVQVFGRQAPLVLEIGCGMGDSTVMQAEAAPDIDVLAIDVHTPGLGSLLREQNRRGVSNIRAMEADAVTVIELMIAPESLHGVRIYFPDPWPKVRQRKRRLIQQPFVSLLLPRLAPGGFIHCATDDLGYGEQMLQVFGDEDGLVNAFDGFAPRPPDRPVTKYERRAQRHGRSVVDIYVTRRLDP